MRDSCPTIWTHVIERLDITHTEGNETHYWRYYVVEDGVEDYITTYNIVGDAATAAIMNTAEGIEVSLTGLAGLVGFEAWAILLLFVSAGLA